MPGPSGSPTTVARPQFMNFLISCDSIEMESCWETFFVSISTGFNGVCKLHIVFKLSTVQLYRLLLLAYSCLCIDWHC